MAGGSGLPPEVPADVVSTNVGQPVCKSRPAPPVKQANGQEVGLFVANRKRGMSQRSPSDGRPNERSFHWNRSFRIVLRNGLSIMEAAPRKPAETRPGVISSSPGFDFITSVSAFIPFLPNCRGIQGCRGGSGSQGGPKENPLHIGGSLGLRFLFPEPGVSS